MIHSSRAGEAEGTGSSLIMNKNTMLVIQVILGKTNQYITRPEVKQNPVNVQQIRQSILYFSNAKSPIIIFLAPSTALFNSEVSASGSFAARY